MEADVNRKSVSLSLLLLACAALASAQLSGPSYQLLIPAAGSVDGANGTHFRSDITVTNFRNVDQRVQFGWIPDPDTVPFMIDPPIPSFTLLTIPASGSISSEDFFKDHLPYQWTIGGMLISALTQDGQIDKAALLQATERIWTAQAGTNGTTSQTFSVLDAAQIPSGGRRVMIFGHHLDDRFRTNVGIVNLDPYKTVTWQIMRNSDIPSAVPLTMTVTLPPSSMKQVSLSNPPAKNLQIWIDVLPLGSVTSGPWVAYASTVDNVTGDSWSNVVLPRQE